MPNYTFRCEKCGITIEAIVSKAILSGEYADLHCPDCGGALVRIFVPYVINGHFGETSKYKAGDK